MKPLASSRISILHLLELNTEDICLQYLWQENLKGNLPIVFTDAGRWWGNDPVRKSKTEIDILADNEDQEAILPNVNGEMSL